MGRGLVDYCDYDVYVDTLFEFYLASFERARLAL